MMRNNLLAAFGIYSLLIAASYSGAADLLGGHRCPGGDQCSCPLVEEWVWQDVVCHRCKMVNEAKPIKKTVYEVKEVPFCLLRPPKCGHCGHCDECNACRECGHVRYKKVLVKKEITCGETCTLKCVPEEYIERQQVKICKPACQCQAIPCPAPAAAVDVPLPALVVTDDKTP